MACQPGKDLTPTMTTDTQDDRPLISVITPSYNQAGFIEDTISSVASQCYSRVEHIVVDGESDDGTFDILREHDERLRWISEPDDGQADAINKGFEMANGDVIGWLNSDDVFFDIGVLNRVVGYFDRYDVDVIYGDMALINADSEVLKLQVVPNFDYEQLLVGCFIEQPSLFFRKEVVAKNRLDTDLTYAFDYEFWLRLAREYEFRHVSDILAGDRNHGARKILHQRDAMRRESQAVRERYGGPIEVAHERRRKLKTVTSGVPRAGLAALRTVSMHSLPPELAFDGELRPLAEMVVNAVRRNRNLL